MTIAEKIVRSIVDGVFGGLIFVFARHAGADYKFSLALMVVWFSSCNIADAIRESK